MAAYDTDDDLEQLIDTLGLDRPRAHELRRRWPGRPVLYPSSAASQPVPDVADAALPWHHPELMGLRPPQWSAAEHEKAIRAVLGAPTAKLTARAAFGAGTDVPADADLQSQNAIFLSYRITWSKSVAANSVVAEVKQARRYAPMTGPRVRLEALFGSPTEWQAWMTLIVPNEGLQVQMTAEGVVGAAHNVDLCAHGWIVGLGRLPAGG